MECDFIRLIKIAKALKNLNELFEWGILLSHFTSSMKFIINIRCGLRNLSHFEADFSYFNPGEYEVMLAFKSSHFRVKHSLASELETA